MNGVDVVADWSVQTVVVLSVVAAGALIAIVCLLMGRRMLVKLGRLELQVTPNGGDTDRLGDQVLRLHHRMDKFEDRLDAYESRA